MFAKFKINIDQKFRSILTLFFLALIILGAFLVFSNFKESSLLKVIPGKDFNQGESQNQSLSKNIENNSENKVKTLLNLENLKESLKTYKVTRIIDGDTFEIEDGRKVRLIGIDTPERNQYYYIQAKNKLKELIFGKSVFLEKDISEVDKYGRLLRYVWLGNLFVNLEMVTSGYANSATFPPDVKYQDLFLKAEREARENRLGLWGEPIYPNCKYVASKIRKPFHFPWCSWAKRIASENLQCFKTKEGAIKAGHQPCQICKP